jgi:hypothetical protein
MQGRQHMSLLESPRNVKTKFAISEENMVPGRKALPQEVTRSQNLQAITLT